MISQHILGEFHYFTVHGPEHLSWSLLSTEHFGAMLQNLWSQSNPHFKFHYTEQLCERSDSLTQHWSILCSLIVYPETLVCSFIQFVIVHTTNYFPLQSNCIHTSTWRLVILTGFLWVFCPSRQISEEHVK